MEDMLVPESVAKERKEGRQAGMAEQSELNKELIKAQIRDTLSGAFKNITQGQKNSAAADATTASSAIDIMLAALDPQGPDSGAH
jgi:hypothetical protein